ncbi:MAG: U32 family peptidase [Bacillota bacterium]|nr:U32 family peptidase [Bacillota bacterium]
MKDIEILAPAGNYENLEAAVLAGANAVYLAGKQFGARSFAKNFTKDQLQEVVDYCHIRNVSVYITVNTLVKENEIGKVLGYIKFLYSIDVDAIIIQDIGIAQAVKKQLPDFDLHASTQMTAHSLEDVKFLEKMGFSRVILSREVSIEEIRKIKANSNVELEIFVHGALCVSYSGQCLMSSFIGGRSGNRGKCAQPCRKKYELIDMNSQNIVKAGYLISPKDLSTIEYLEELRELDISSLKIEGRMKTKEYVYTVVDAYKTGLNQNNLRKVFNRNFTKGFLFNEENSNFITENSPGNVGYYIGKIDNVKNNYIELVLQVDIILQDEIQIRRNSTSVGSRIEVILVNDIKVSEAKKGEKVKIKFMKKAIPGDNLYKTYDVLYNKVIDKILNDKSLEIKIDFLVKIKIDQNPILIIKDELGNTVEDSIDFIVQKASNKPVTEEKIIKNLNKLGNTPYKVNNISLDCDENIFIPISQINLLRRLVIEKLDQVRKNRYGREDVKMALKKTKRKKNNQKKLFIKVNNIADLKIVLDYNVDGIYYSDIDSFDEALELSNGKNIYLSLYRITSSDEYEKINYFKNKNIKFQIGNIGQLNFLENEIISANYGLNIFNSLSTNFYLNKNIKRIVLSPELTLEEMNEISSFTNIETEAIIYGRIPVMTTKYNFIKKGENLVLRDSFDEQFKLNYINDNVLEILYSKTLFMLDNYRDLLNSNIDVFTVNFTGEDEKLMREVIKSHIFLVNNEIVKDFITIRDNYKMSLDKTTGHFFNKVI